MRVLAALLIVVAAAPGACSRPAAAEGFRVRRRGRPGAGRGREVGRTRRTAGSAGPRGEATDRVRRPGEGQEPLASDSCRSTTEAHALESSAEGFTTLVVGEDKWPFPFPLVETDGRWRFDSTAGVEQVVNRRVGENELLTIQSCLAFVDAEREYYMRNPQKDPLLHFAQKLVSSEGQKDGLYWPTADGEEPSPLGERLRAGAQPKDISRTACPRRALPRVRLSAAQGAGTRMPQAAPTTTWLATRCSAVSRSSLSRRNTAARA